MRFLKIALGCFVQDRMVEKELTLGKGREICMPMPLPGRSRRILHVCNLLAERGAGTVVKVRYLRCDDDSCSWLWYRPYTVDVVTDLVEPLVQLFAESWSVVGVP